jgi:signal transduction histidine kinase/ActR/RegA family two-component response regulator
VFTGIYLGILIFDGIFFSLLFNLLYGEIFLLPGAEIIQKIIIGSLYSIALLVFLLTHRREVIDFTHEKFNFILLRKKSKVELIDEIKHQYETLIDIETRTQNIESLGVLAGGIAHDFNNLLAVISGNLSLTQEDLKDLRKTPDDLGLIDDMNDLFSIIQDSVIKGKNLSDQLLMLAKIKKPNRERLDVLKLIEKAALLALSGSNISYKVNTSLSNCNWVLDVAQINQVLINLLLNAKQSMLSGGTITIHLLVEKIVDIPEEILKNPPKISKKSYLMIGIQDQGVGIPEKELSYIFDPYYSTKKSGKGLGLTMCHSIIKNHDGFIHVESKVGEGTTIGVFLPKKNISRKFLVKKEVDQRAITNLKILLMDDNVELLDTLARILMNLSHRVEKVTKGEESIKIYQTAWDNKEPFDIIFLDLIIKDGMGGIETLKQLKKVNPDVKAVCVSGYHDSDILKKPKKYGFLTAIQKPFTKEQLDIVITNLLAED